MQVFWLFSTCSFFCFSLIEVGHTLLGLEKVRLHSRELKSSQEERVEGWGKKSKKSREGCETYSEQKSLQAMSCFISFICVWKYLGKEHLISWFLYDMIARTLFLLCNIHLVISQQITACFKTLISHSNKVVAALHWGETAICLLLEVFSTFNTTAHHCQMVTPERSTCSLIQSVTKKFSN